MRFGSPRLSCSCWRYARYASVELARSRSRSKRKRPLEEVRDRVRRDFFPETFATALCSANMGLCFQHGDRAWWMKAALCFKRSVYPKQFVRPGRFGMFVVPDR